MERAPLKLGCVLALGLLLITMGPGAAVVCFSSAHVMFEHQDALCCNPANAFGLGSRENLDPQALDASAGCGDCVDVPLLATSQPQVASTTLSARVLAFVPQLGSKRSVLPRIPPESAFFARYDRGSPSPPALSSVPLRC